MPRMSAGSLFSGMLAIPDESAAGYRCVGPPEVLGDAGELGAGLSGVLSPASPITLDKQTRIAAGIPINAVGFSFAYPSKGSGLPFLALLPALLLALLLAASTAAGC